MLKGGYLIISKDDANIYAKLQDALTNGKPVLFYENDTTCYYIDTIALSGDDIVLTKGGKTFTVTDVNTVMSTGEVQNHLYKYNGVYTESNGVITFSILTSKDIDFTEITIAKLTELFGGKNNINPANGIYVVDNISYGNVYGLVCEETDCVCLYNVPSTSLFQIDSNEYYAFDGNEPSKSSESLTLSNLTITKTQIF